MRQFDPGNFIGVSASLKHTIQPEILVEVKLCNWQILY